MNIVALVYISLSEIQRVYPTITDQWVDENPEKFKSLLFSLGVNVSEPVDIQKEIQHRNRFGDVVTSTRYVGNERIDHEWVTSGHASQSAIDKSKNNRFVLDLYKSKGEVE